jgi:hypothetical protein
MGSKSFKNIYLRLKKEVLQRKPIYFVLNVWATNKARIIYSNSLSVNRIL